LNGSKSNPIFSSFPISLKFTDVFQLFDLFFPSEFWNDSILFLIDQNVEGKAETTQMD
jgi:hypothetical protein